MAKAKKKTVKELTHDLIFHMLETGWSVNHEYLGNFKTNEVDFEALMLGKDGNKNHLIAEVGEETFTAKFTGKRLVIWRMKPSWRKLCNIPIGQIQLLDNGFEYSKQTGIVLEHVKIIIPHISEDIED